CAPRARLIALLQRLDAPDLAEKLWTVRDVRELPPDVRGQMLDVIGHHAAECGVSRDGTENQIGRELDELAIALGLDDERPRGRRSWRDARARSRRNAGGRRG